MLTAIYSLEYVNGAEIWIAGFVGCAVLYLLGNSLWKQNRTRGMQLLLWVSLLAAEICCDIVWKWIYYPRGEYVNHGLGGVVWLLVWPGILLLFSGLICVLNQSESRTGA